MNLNLEITSLPLNLMSQLLDRAGLKQIMHTARYGWDGSDIMLAGEKVGFITPGGRVNTPIRMVVWTKLVPFDTFTTLAYAAVELQRGLEAEAAKTA